MTEAAAPAAPAPAQTAAPSAVARVAPSDIGEPKDAFAAARAEMRARKSEQRKLKLAASDGERVDDNADAMPDNEEPATGAEGDEHQADAEQTEDAAEEKEPTWAQKLRDDLEKKTSKLAEVEKTTAEREAKWSQAVQATTHKLEDMADDVTHYKGLFEQTLELLKQVGHPIDEVSLQLVNEQREKKRLERMLKRGESTKTEQQKGELVTQHKTAIEGAFRGLSQKFAELDPKKNKDAREFIEAELARYQQAGRFDDGLEARARRWVLGWRAENAARMQKSTTKPQKPAQRPDSTTMAGTANSGRTAPGKPQVREGLTNKQLKDEVRQYRASRQR